MNFIFLCADEMRAESLGCYGHPTSITPNIDRLASQGTRFEQCHVQHTVCSPSRVSSLTGWYPHVRGHRTLWHLLRPDEPNLYKYLKQAGYQVRWWGKNDTFAPETWANSVDHIHGPSPAMKPYDLKEAPLWDIDDPRYFSFLMPRRNQPMEQLNDWGLTRGAIEFLESRPTQPFAINLNLLYPHPSYWAPDPYYDLIDPDSLPPLRPPVSEGKPAYHREIRRTRRLDQLDDAAFRKINAVYLGMISVIDKLLGDLMQTLERTGLDKNTAIIFFSDHGDFAGDFGLVEKWTNALDDILTRVPLIIRAPGMKPGHTVSESVELFDIMATALDLAGVKAQHTHFAHSLIDQLAGAPGDPDRAVFAEGGYDLHEPRSFEGLPDRDGFIRSSTDKYYPKGRLQQDHPEIIARCAMVRTPTHKLIRRTSGEHELYDLQRDPRELLNLYGHPDHASPQRHLESRLLDWYLHTSDVVPLDENPRGLPPMKRET